MPLRSLIITFMVLTLGFQTSQAAIYYLSETRGDDSVTTPTQDAPWQTLAKITAYAKAGNIHAGDSILFEKGSTFQGSFNPGTTILAGNSTHRITISSF